ncbi:MULTISPECIES: LolA-like outer membrane lipoprotein chaperone [unclassified Helicobacter]|uniref:LolA-like outer membrane lipoprotein chaperone n=1 Tax=unclassified Helicobacter TaxID=2593540 RepID=UPI000CF0648C|nr:MULTISPECIES: LolA-like outer membrane lipoprotein chaperone [unclassified Helicobacter]
MTKKLLLYFSTLLLLLGWGENIKSIKADFIQTTYQNDEKIIYSGKLFAINPNLAKWVYTSPIKKEIYLNGNNVIIFEPLLEQATISHIAQQVDFFSIVTSAKVGEDGNYHTRIGNTDYTLILRNNLPYQILYKDDFQNSIEISLEQVKINISLDKKIFDFTPNEHIDIIRQ